MNTIEACKRIAATKTAKLLAEATTEWTNAGANYICYQWIIGAGDSPAATKFTLRPCGFSHPIFDNAPQVIQLPCTLSETEFRETAKGRFLREISISEISDD